MGSWTETETETKVLEITLISAQNLEGPKNTIRNLKTYVMIWKDPSNKLRTQLDQIGGKNPTWNDTFLFRVTPEYLASVTSGFSVAIYAAGTFNDHLIGTVRILVSNILSNVDPAVKPCFSAVQVRRQSGRFQGVLNVGARVVDESYFPALYKMPAIGLHDLMLKVEKQRRTKGVSSHDSSFSDSTKTTSSLPSPEASSQAEDPLASHKAASGFDV
ncbi:hypothetical protein PIB30_012502 [Stylosanthes scabra]|uniref:C2 domain-containing protein n=1 Tax=Stylosanthes scabra TaxID=79078 RepID=A0ABU6U4X7_9FABA|nr:hypothetical protein [Stylosanthes scabra]